MTESYQQYQTRMAGFPQENRAILSEAEFNAHHAKAKTPETQQKQALAVPRVFSAIERDHMTVLAAEAEQATRFRDPEHSETTRLGLTSVAETLRRRVSHEEALGTIQTAELENCKAEAERQKQIEREATNLDHQLEMAAKALESDRIRAAKIQADKVSAAETRNVEARHGSRKQ